MSNCPKCNAKISDDDRFCPDCGHDLRGTISEAAIMTVGGLETLDDATTHATKASSQKALEPGTEFAARYMIEEIIGRGGMGIVYKAKDNLTEQIVALKLIRTDRLGGEGAIRRLISEGITARSIRHPNVVAVYDVGDADGQPYVSMEYLRGDSLRGWHRKKIQAREDIPLRIAARIVAEILDGLKAAHDSGVIHRDLKPENIILLDEPTETAAPLKILDFGIAQATTNALDSNTGTGIGTPRYMAPEQITHASSVGPAADLYSVSVLFYELLVDVLPQGHWQPPSGGRSDVPAAIDALIEKGLSNRPASRPQAATEYRKALVDAVNLGPSVRKQNGADKPTGLPLNNNIMKWAGIGSAALVALILIFSLVPDDTGPGPGPIDPCDGLYGEALSACLGIDPEPEPGPGPVKPDPIRPDPPPTPIQSLSGRWDDGLGSLYNIRVNRNGSFSGTGTGADGTALQLSGRFEGVNGTYTLTAPAFGMSFNGSLVWDQGCHINYRTTDIYGNAIQGQLHVNHTPGAPCPA